MVSRRRRSVPWTLLAAALASAWLGGRCFAASTLSPVPRAVIDFEYASADGSWNSPGLALSGAASCTRASADGAWDAGHGYAGIVLDLGDPLGLQAHAGSLARAEAMLRSTETCFAQGFAAVSAGVQPLIYIGFSNCVPSRGVAGVCGSLATSTAIYGRAGDAAAAYVASGTTDVAGAWVDFESDWSTVGAVHREVLAYLARSPAAGGGGQWCDSSYRNDAPGLPNSTWTAAAMARLYLAPVLAAGYTCLGAERILIPQAYAASWLTDGAANYAPASPLAAYVGGITVCGAVESHSRCPDLGVPSRAAQPTKWYDYQHDGYPAAASGVLVVVAGGLLGISA